MTREEKVLALRLFVMRRAQELRIVTIAQPGGRAQAGAAQGGSGSGGLPPRGVLAKCAGEMCSTPAGPTLESWARARSRERRGAAPASVEGSMSITGSIIMMLALASPPEAEKAGVPRTATCDRPDSPTATVECLGRAYTQKSLESYAALLTADYRFHLDPKGRIPLSRFSEGFDRAFELKSTAGLFHGLVVDGRIVTPGGDSIRVSRDSLWESPDPEHPDSTAHYRLVIVPGFTLEMRLPNSEFLKISSGLHVFHLVRGDAAVRAEGQSDDAGRWYIRRWLEGVDELALALADDKGRCGEPPGKPGAGRSLALAIRPLGNPACPALDIMCDLPGTEPARIDVFDVMGRLMNRRDLAAPAPGSLRIAAGEGANLAPGVYWVRLTQAARRPSTRMVVVVVAR